MSSISPTCSRRAQSMRSQQQVMYLTSHQLSVHCSRSLHTELAADADNCRCKHGQSRHSIYPHRCCRFLPLWRESPILSPCCITGYTSNSVAAAAPVKSLTHHNDCLPLALTHSSDPSVQPSGIHLLVSSPMVSDQC